jgi:hypothetical protein
MLFAIVVVLSCDWCCDFKNLFRNETPNWHIGDPKCLIELFKKHTNKFVKS